MTPRQKLQNGSAILIILITLALFAALSYAFFQNSRGNIGWLMSEKSKANVTSAQDCANNITAATKRLEARGCGSLISIATDGTNTNPGAPTDGSCSIYHPNGGAVKNCAGLATTPDPCALASPTPGTLCNDGTVFVGLRNYGSGNEKLFIHRNIQSASSAWRTSGSSNDISIDSLADGRINVANLLFSISNYPAIKTCDDFAGNGKTDWYLPANSEANFIDINRAALDPSLNFTLTGGIWTSSEGSTSQARYYILTSGFSVSLSKGVASGVRCVRREP